MKTVLKRIRSNKIAGASILARAVTLFSRLLLIVFLAKWFSLSDAGTIGLLTSTFAFSIAFLGLDFFYYSGRELLDSNDQERPVMLRDQFIFHSMVSLFTLPCFLVFFYSSKFDWSLLWIFYGLLLTEHVGQEAYRLLVMLKKPFHANVCLFIRMGSWIIPMLLCMHQGYIEKELLNILWFWLGGGILSIICAFYSLRGWKWGNVFSQKVNWHWIKRGIPVILLYIVTTQAGRAANFVDRQLIDYILGREIVAVYVFYFGIAAAVVSFIDAGVVSQQSPLMIEKVLKKRNEEAAKLAKSLVLKILVFGGCLIVVSYLFIPPLLTWVKRIEYKEYMNLYPLVALAAIVGVLAGVPNSLLYGLKKDKEITKCSLYGIGAFVFFLILFIYFLGVLGIPIAVICFHSFVGILKVRLLKKYSFFNNARSI